MKVDCEGCGRCCVSPFTEIMVSKVKQAKTKHLLMSIGPSLVEDGIIIPEKVARSGDMLLRDEMERMIDEGLIEALAPSTLLFHEISNAKAMIFRLRHIMMPFEGNGVIVPVFGCIFFDHETRKCEIFTKDFRPLQCRVFPFNTVYTVRKLKQDIVTRGHITILPTCGSGRLKGVLSVKQTKQIEEYLDLLKTPKRAFKIDSATRWKELITGLRFPATVPISDGFLQVLGMPVKSGDASEGWAIADWRRDLSRITTRILSGVFGKEKVNPLLTDEQKNFVQHIKEKLAKSHKWWRDFRLSKENIKEIYEAMVEVFRDRYMTNLTLQYAKRRNTSLHNYLSSFRG